MRDSHRHVRVAAVCEQCDKSFYARKDSLGRFCSRGCGFRFHANPRPFWSFVDTSVGLDSCWLWTGTRDRKGYGWHRLGKAHRVAYAEAHGSVPEGLHVCHHCDTPACCNPLHLFAATNYENRQDSKRKGRTRNKFTVNLT